MNKYGFTLDGMHLIFDQQSLVLWREVKSCFERVISMKWAELATEAIRVENLQKVLGDLEKAGLVPQPTGTKRLC